MSGNGQIANFLFELGTLRKIPRMHQQTLLSQDLSDNIAAHSFRVALTTWFLAKMENADPYKAVMMALLHDIKETRSGDHNYVHKRYVKIEEDKITEEQLGSLPFDDLIELVKEYEERTSIEAVVAKDADLLDQILLLKEYEHQGNKEASIWLSGKANKNKVNAQFHALKTKSAKQVGKKILSGEVSAWWNDIWTMKNKK